MLARETNTLIGMSSCMRPIGRFKLAMLEHEGVSKEKVREDFKTRFYDISLVLI